jgi:hypothetical protein
MKAIVSVHFSTFPLDNELELSKMERGFANIASCHNEMRGCVGAVDGCAVSIKQPSFKEDPRQKRYYCRKGFFALNLQAVCDSRRKFTYAKVASPGSVNDCIAWSAECELAQEMLAGRLPEPYWIAGDAAYGCYASLLSPFPGQDLPDREDAFNFYLSQKRINIECAFGMLIQRFGVLWAPLRCSLRSAVVTIYACICIHNFILDNTAHLKLSNFFTLQLPPTVQYRTLMRRVSNGERMPRLRMTYNKPTVDRYGRPLSHLNSCSAGRCKRGDVLDASKRDQLADALSAEGYRRLIHSQSTASHR